MPLKERLQEDMKAALKEKGTGKLKLSVIRLALSEIKNKEIDVQKELDDAAITEVLNKEVKKRREAIPEYERLGRTETVNELEQEIKILSVYLPEQMTAEELKSIVRETITETGAAGRGDIGKVMSAVMPKVKGRADGKFVNKIVSEMLS